MRMSGKGASPPLSSSSAHSTVTRSLVSTQTEATHFQQDSVAPSVMVKQAATTAPLAISDEEQKESGLSAAEAISPQVPHVSAPTSTDAHSAAPLSVPIVDISNPRRRRTYGQQRVSEDHKRERNRETFRRFYKRKQETLRELREQEEQLAHKYEMLKLSHPEITHSAGASTDEHGSSLVQLITHKDRVSAEQSVLQRAAQEQLRIRRQLGRIVDAFHDDEEHELVGQTTSSLVSQASVDVDATLQNAIGQLSAMQLISEISQRDDAFGWQCWSQPQGEYVAVQLVKQFLTMALTPEQAARRTWEFYSESKSSGSSEPSPSRVAPSSMVRMRRRVLSTSIDYGRSSRLVFRRLTRVHREPDSSSLPSLPGDRPLRMAKSVYHVTLTPLANAGGFAVVSHSVPNQELREPVDNDILDALGDMEHPHTHATMFADDTDLKILVGATPREIHEEWIRELSWWRVEPSESEGGVRVTFAGYAPVGLALTPCACFMEVLRLAVQWENVVLGETPISCLDR